MKYYNGLYQLLNALESFNKDRIQINVNEDTVGLAKDDTLKGLYTKHVGDYPISVSNTGTAAAWETAFSSAIDIPETGEYGLVLAIDTATTVKLEITVGTKVYSYLLNDGNSLAADAWYMFAICLAEGDAINLSIYTAAGATITGILRVFKR